MAIKVIVSSTSNDMGRDYRPAVRDAILRLRDVHLVAMEYFGSHDESGTSLSVKEVAASDVYVGLIGWRYGYVAPGQTASVTQLEYEEAYRLDKHIRIYLASEAARATFPPGSIDTDGGSPEQQIALQRLTAFRNRLQTRHTCSFFATPGDLAARVTSDLHYILMGGPEGEVRLKRGRAALARGDYASAVRDLQEAVDTIREDALPAEAARARFLLAVAQLNGRRPFSQTLPVMRAVEGLMQAAISLDARPSYLMAFALFKLDFSRNGLPQLRVEAVQLLDQAKRMPITQDDQDNLDLLARCQPSLFKEYLSG